MTSSRTPRTLRPVLLALLGAALLAPLAGAQTVTVHSDPGVGPVQLADPGVGPVQLADPGVGPVQLSTVPPVPPRS
ncbi:hypothetical protein GO986_07635 [Deinococcus sp. HMF7620]|uniref:Uncharacterized protein n=1 Tax=Deinococcus arboris TaxID=2682977 RepID=A0A7C9HZ45_9DEIO|nr:hypothetical protein [Deinococcus arboris]MVN86635.1 hypothetical protein [Deinococcus arboris]